MRRRNLYLGGFMGSGKTTVGRCLGEQAGRPFLDLDELAEARTGFPVAELFRRRGEEAFRQLESELLEEAAALEGCVVALGGGALLREENRALLTGGTLAILEVSPEEAARRTAREAGRRPLLDRGNLEDLWARRRGLEPPGDLRLPTDGKTPEDLARELAELLGWDSPAPPSPARPLGSQGCRVLVGRGVLVGLEGLLAEQGLDLPFGVADRITGPLYASRLGAHRGLYLLPRGEAAKTPERVTALHRALARAGVDRGGALVALGGGTVGDAAGYAAATWMRGIDLVQCPTTLLAQVDSSLGGKVGVDLPEGKNLVGAFHLPRLVVADVECLLTQAWGDFRQGLAEAVKVALGEDPPLLGWMEEHREGILRRDLQTLEELVARCVALKLGVTEEDFRERTGARARLNLGHTVGHGLEAASGYRGWSHGDGVAVGLVVVARLACRRGLLDEGMLTRLAALLEGFGLPTLPDRPWEDLLPHVERDKKFVAGAPRLVLPRGGQRCVLREDVPLEELGEVYEEVRAWGRVGSSC